MLRTLTVSSACLLLLASCAGTTAGVQHVAAPISGAEEIEVVATEFSFQPVEIVVDAGEPVNITLRNDGRGQHDLSSGELGVHVHASAGATQTAGYTFEEPGRYELICSIPGHLRQGMEMTLVVR